MKAAVVTEQGVQYKEAPKPSPKPNEILIKVRAASLNRADLAVASGHRHGTVGGPGTIVGLECAGEVEAVGAEVKDFKPGDRVMSSAAGGFAEYAVIPKDNARPTDTSIPRHIAAFQDALGNAVHTAFDGPIKDQTILITGMGPIGLFAASVCKAVGAAKVIATEVSPYRIELAHRIGLNVVLSPKEHDVAAEIKRLVPEGVDGTLEMSGHSSALHLAIECTRPGGRISMLGLYSVPEQTIHMNAVIFKGLRMQGIVGRRLWETWDQMHKLLEADALCLEPVVTHRMHYTEFQEAMELMKNGEAGKIVFNFD